MQRHHRRFPTRQVCSIIVPSFALILAIVSFSVLSFVQLFSQAGTGLEPAMTYEGYRRSSRKQQSGRGMTENPDNSITNIHSQHQHLQWLKAGRSIGPGMNESLGLPSSSDFMHQAQVQIQRQRVLREACRRHPELADVKLTRRNAQALYALEKNRVLLCSVPKAGSTNWKKVLMVVEGRRQHVKNITGFEAHKQHPFRDLSIVRPKERDYIIAHYYPKFLYVRHPFVRLISAYRSKIARKKAKQGKGFQNIARHIAFRYRQGPRAPRHILDTGASYNVTWDEFISYLTNPIEIQSFNEHWREYYKLCFPCKIEYDFIGNLETIGEDSAYMLSLLGLDGVSYPTFAESSSALYDQYFANISLNALQRLWEIYKLDFELFNYAKPDRLR